MADTILVIDDSAEIQTILKLRLGSDLVDVHGASDGPSGIAAARELKPDLILLDVDMPGNDGFAVCADLKADQETQQIPIIFLSGANSASDKIRGLELGAADYVAKPFDHAELLARVRASLRTSTLVHQLAKKAMVDGLTGLWNRTYLDAHLTIEMHSARRSHQPLSCVMADVDAFKSINDTYGHAFGDELLRAIADVLATNCRMEDIVCRYGGEEFAILLPRTPLHRAAELAERLRIAVAAQEFHFGDQPVSVTCSFGVANLRASIPPSILELADQALYAAKHAGRNCVEISPEPQLIEA